MYAKTADELRSWEFMKKEKLSFDLVVLLASSIIGRSIQEGYLPSKENLGGDVQYLSEFLWCWEARIPLSLRDLSLDPHAEDKTLIFKGMFKMWLLFTSKVSTWRFLGMKDISLRDLLIGPQLANKIRKGYPQLRNRVPEGVEVERIQENLINTDISKFEKVTRSDWND
jgi:NADPH-dependent methylglyoxal reductase